MPDERVTPLRAGRQLVLAMGDDINHESRIIPFAMNNVGKTPVVTRVRAAHGPSSDTFCVSVALQCSSDARSSGAAQPQRVIRIARWPGVRRCTGYEAACREGGRTWRLGVMAAGADGSGGELPGCAPHTSTSKTTDCFLKPGFASGKDAIDLCEREAAVFAGLAGDHRIPDGAMCICNPVYASHAAPASRAPACFSRLAQPIAGSSRLLTNASPPAVLAGLPAHLRQRDVLQANWVPY
jgi:hypothetical protein